MSRIFRSLIAVSLALTIASCATAPQPEPQADLTPPARKPFDAKTQLESGRVR